jgi:hypothetical protein
MFPETINIQRTHKKHRCKELFLAATNASILASFRGRVALLRPYTTVINLLNHVPFVQVNKAQDRKLGNTVYALHIAIPSLQEGSRD